MNVEKLSKEIFGRFAKLRNHWLDSELKRILTKTEFRTIKQWEADQMSPELTTKMEIVLVGRKIRVEIEPDGRQHFCADGDRHSTWIFDRKTQIAAWFETK